MNNLNMPIYKTPLRFLLILVLAAGFIFNFYNPQEVKAGESTGSATTVSIDPATKNVSAGDTFTLNVLISPATAIAGAQFNLSYNPAVLQVDTVTGGGLLNQNGNTSFFMPGVIDNTAGLLKNVAGAITTPGGEVSEAGALAAVSFKAKASGTSDLVLSNVKAGNKEGQAVPVQITGGSVAIQGGTTGEPVSGGSGGGGGGSTIVTPGVQTGDAAGITDSSVILNGSITSNGGSAISSYGFAWGTDQNNPDKRVTVGTDNHSGSFQTSLSGLSGGTTYYFKAYAVNSKGTKQGEIKRFTTAAESQQPSGDDKLPNVISGNAKSFTDVAGSHWAYDAISQLSESALINGYPDGTFRPDREMSRAEFVTVLDKALQLPDYKPVASSFGDVSLSDWYAGAVETVVHAGIISGYGNGSFGPNDPVTREQASVILIKALGKDSEAAARMGDSTKFTDDAAISSWARGFVVTAVEQNLLKGYPDGTFRPQQNMTRAEICTVVKNLLASLKETD
ncbi:S-layer domain protein [Desulfofarcimen acetoxidans DSM 771]|uniref:S-layer domain protein n=1 Tax=Desulfofarcimen acetoxidans (strain ATCC 49208 / DSM 771 / KCTC 5769 / VKM B-1644 / 5575) TaxID=485916 RepID=C8VYD6_DESAS|nr:S-layer homology domain-containing protein [Desulfofarcimen acetoxidans]ACV62817.1 S-layer domain protein [Desulfofarcimen acetoxidans DSM 771]